MFEYAISGILILAGIIIAWQGLQTVQNKRRVKMKLFEKMLFQKASAEGQEKLNKILGTMRFVYGLFFVGLGIYFLFTLNVG